MFIGCRGTVRAAPTVRGALSREASDASTLMPVAVSAGARFGLSTGICGRDFSPECSRVTTSLAVIGMPCCWAQVTFWLISDWIVDCGVHWVLPSGLVAQRHGVTVKSCTQPRYRCEYVWL